MNDEDLKKKVFAIIGQTEKSIKELKKDKDLTHPIDSDLQKTLKAMAYEKILEECRKYKKENE